MKEVLYLKSNKNEYLVFELDEKNLIIEELQGMSFNFKKLPEYITLMSQINLHNKQVKDKLKEGKQITIYQRPGIPFVTTLSHLLHVKCIIK